MLHIKKASPPIAIQQDITRVKSTPPSWASIRPDDTKAIRVKFDTLNKDTIREALLTEQHHLCAYCMKRIRNDGNNMSIEHFHPLSDDKENALNYTNFLGVCKGGAVRSSGDKSDNNRILCCDASKGNETKLTINPFDEKMMQCIAYYKDGIVYFNNASNAFPPEVAEAITKDINDTLCLNGKFDHTGNRVDTSTYLLKGRKDAYERAQAIINHLKGKGKLSSHNLDIQIKKLENASERCEFVGVILFFLRRERKRLAAQYK